MHSIDSKTIKPVNIHCRDVEGLKMVAEFQELTQTPPLQVTQKTRKGDKPSKLFL